MRGVGQEHIQVYRVLWWVYLDVKVLCEVLLVLSIASPFLFGIENPEMKNIRESSREAAINGEKYISLDSYSFHITGLHPQEKISSKK